MHVARIFFWGGPNINFVTNYQQLTGPGSELLVKSLIFGERGGPESMDISPDYMSENRPQRIFFQPWVGGGDFAACRVELRERTRFWRPLKTVEMSSRSGIPATLFQYRTQRNIFTSRRFYTSLSRWPTYRLTNFISDRALSLILFSRNRYLRYVSVSTNANNIIVAGCLSLRARCASAIRRTYARRLPTTDDGVVGAELRRVGASTGRQTDKQSDSTAFTMFTAHASQRLEQRQREARYNDDDLELLEFPNYVNDNQIRQMVRSTFPVVSTVKAQRVQGRSQEFFSKGIVLFFPLWFHSFRLRYRLFSIHVNS